MNLRPRFALFVVALAMTALPAEAQVAMAAREAAEVLAATLGRSLGKAGTSEAAEQIARLGGREGLEILASRTLREGGEQALRKVVANAAKYGPDYLMVLKNARSPQFMAKVLDELPADAVKPAIRALGRKSTGEALEVAVETCGVKALQAEVKYQGVGSHLVESFGDDGLAAVSSVDEAATLVRHADDITRLPAAQKAGVLQLLHDDGKQMVAFMGRFVEKNPQTVLFTSAATTVILANSERLLGGDDIALDARARLQRAVAALDAAS